MPGRIRGSALGLDGRRLWLPGIESSLQRVDVGQHHVQSEIKKVDAGDGDRSFAGNDHTSIQQVVESFENGEITFSQSVPPMRMNRVAMGR